MRRLLVISFALLLAACGKNIEGTYSWNPTGVPQQKMSITFKPDGTSQVAIGGTTIPLEMPFKQTGDKIVIQGAEGPMDVMILENGDLLTKGMRLTKETTVKVAEQAAPGTQSPSFAEPKNVATPFKSRFGELSIDAENVLTFKGKPVSPLIQGNSSLSLADYQQGKASDIYVVQDTGGTACPAQYYFVTLSAEGVKQSKAFGTCSDLLKTQKNGEGIIVSMPGANEDHIFTLAGNEVFDNGKPAK